METQTGNKEILDFFFIHSSEGHQSTILKFMIYILKFKNSEWILWLCLFFNVYLNGFQTCIFTYIYCIVFKVEVLIYFQMYIWAHVLLFSLFPNIYLTTFHIYYVTCRLYYMLVNMMASLTWGSQNNLWKVICVYVYRNG